MKMERSKGNFQCSIIKMVSVIQLLRILTKLSSIKVDRVSNTISQLFPKYKMREIICQYCVWSCQTVQRETTDWDSSSFHIPGWCQKTRISLLFFMEECNIKMKIIMKRMPNSENFEKNNIFSKSFLNLKMISRIQTIL